MFIRVTICQLLTYSFFINFQHATVSYCNQNASLGAAQTGTDDGPASTSMFCEHRKQRTGTGIFRWSVDEACGRTTHKNQRREKFCESSRRNPAKQHCRAFFGYFLPPREKSINNASETEARKTTHKVSERQDFALTNSTPPLALRRPQRTTGPQAHRCSANIASNGQAQEFFAGVLTKPAAEQHTKISDVKNSANLVAGIRRSSRKGRFLDTFCRPGQKVS